MPYPGYLRLCFKASHGVNLSFEINQTYILSCYGNQNHFENIWVDGSIKITEDVTYGEI